MDRGGRGICHRRRVPAALHHGPRDRGDRASYFNLPASKEGFIPGAANFRLPRLVGIKLSREGIFFERVFHADTPEGRLICDEIVATGEMDAAIERNARQLVRAGMTSAVCESEGAARRRGAAIGFSPILRDLCAPAELLPVRSEADRQPEAQLESRQPPDVKTFGDRICSSRD